MPTKEYWHTLYPEFGVRRFHDAGHRGRGVTVYIIDTGLEGLPRNVTLRSASSAKQATHGAFVAAILAAKEPEFKYSGIAPEATFYANDVAGSDGIIYTGALTAAILDAIQLGCDIISISLGTNAYDKDLEAAVNKANAAGILVFAASGNCSCRAYEWPSSCDNAISVASMDLHRNPSPFNTRNDFVSVYAPGQNLLVPAKTAGPAGLTGPLSATRLSGTSFAVPFASGLAALELCRKRAIDGPKYRMRRDEAIGALHAILDLDCAHQAYGKAICGPKAPERPYRPVTHEALFWFAILCLLMSLASFWWALQSTKSTRSTTK